MNYVAAKSEADEIIVRRTADQENLAMIIIQTMPQIVNENRRNTSVAVKQLKQLLSVMAPEDQLETMIKVFLKMC